MASTAISRPHAHGIGSIDHRDPLATLRQCLGSPLHPQEYWPSTSCGHLELLQACGPSLVKPLRRSDHARKQTIYNDCLAGASLSAISVSREKSWRNAIRATLCKLNRRDAAIVCISAVQVQSLVRLLRRMEGEEYQQSGGKLQDPPVLLVEQLGGQQFQEIFVAPEINPVSSTREDLIAVVNATRVGLHLVDAPRS